eukprot:NODE_3495_length_411_cov_147.235915_g3445_i0.p1 GENE.NODE_3495_length_411_cov_147.235915_g3445_i0~~NODE_3495_length_411_cov_147.235915_g3445_i0.p1  ORF type:complete len:100 (-),score=12.88 NODE_3495_length_411_cov_147.235915_g3445_i0:56-355(-)
MVWLEHVHNPWWRQLWRKRLKTYFFSPLIVLGVFWPLLRGPYKEMEWKHPSDTYLQSLRYPLGYNAKLACESSKRREFYAPYLKNQGADMESMLKIKLA